MTAPTPTSSGKYPERSSTGSATQEQQAVPAIRVSFSEVDSASHLRLAKMRRILLLSVVVMSCAKSPAPADTTSTAPVNAQALGGREWRLVWLDSRADPRGAEGREVTLRFEEGARVTGFAGCNRYSGSYTLRGDSITF